VRAELRGLAAEPRHLNECLADYEAQIDFIAQGDRQPRDLMTIPGSGAKGAIDQPRQPHSATKYDGQ
jgi:hypothetical protein